jgi:hypothetical protein
MYKKKKKISHTSNDKEPASMTADDPRRLPKKCRLKKLVKWE